MAKRKTRSAPAIEAGTAPEPTIGEWQALLAGNVEKAPEIQKTLLYLLAHTPSGRSYLAHVARYRPELWDLENSEIIEYVTTCEALEVLARLLAEPRCGADPDFLLWRDGWRARQPGPDYLYEDLLDISREMERQTPDENVKRRLLVVRAKVESELLLISRRSGA